MSKINYTPGPWESQGRDVRTVRGPDGRGGFHIAECSIHQPQRAEDARLIAAAPDMYEALRAIACRTDEEANAFIAQGPAYQMRIARAVLAKIEGGEG